LEFFSIMCRSWLIVLHFLVLRGAGYVGTFLWALGGNRAV
jgi:hypothetical protein